MSESLLPQKSGHENDQRRTIASMIVLAVKEAHIQGRVGFRLASREIVSDLRLNRLGMMWIFLSPLIYLTAFTALRGMVPGTQSSPFSLNAFSLLAGLIIFQSWMDALSGQLTSYANNGSFLKNIGVTPDVFFYSAFTKAIVYGVPKIVILLAVGLLLGERSWVGMPIYCLIFVLACLNGAAIGYLLAPLAALMNDVRVAVHSSTIVLMGASSVFVTLSTSGSEFFFWSSAINPVSVFVENARYWLVSTPTGVSHFLLSWIPLTFVLSLFSLALNRLVKQIIAERL